MLGDGVYALTAEGDPNVGAVEGEDFLVAFEARATPVRPAAGWTGSASTPTSRSATWCCPLPRGPDARRRRFRRERGRRARPTRS